MRRIPHQLQKASTGLAIVGLLCAVVGVPVRAEAGIPSLIISQLKVTSSNGQFVALYNTTNTTLDMSKYQLEYFNNYDLTKATSSRLIALSGSLPPHSFYEVSDDTQPLCYKITISSQSLGFSSTAGLVEVLALSQTAPGAAASTTMQDAVGWSKTAAAGAQTLPISSAASLLRQPVDASGTPAISSPGAGTWVAVQPGVTDSCKLVTLTSPSAPVNNGLNQLLGGTEPPVVIAQAETGDMVGATLPVADLGLMAPRITELLPNPSGTGNDATDEYIELYNPNPSPFELSGFTLQAGLSSVKSYTFPPGTLLAPQSFTAFYAEVTGLSLSNSGSQAMLLDPFGNSLSTSDVYRNAKDGQAWALANGSWVFTTKPSPGAMNVIAKPPAAKPKSKATNKTTKKVTQSKKTGSSSQNAAAFQPDEAPKTFPIHSRTLALIASGAVLYGAYEYRTDIRSRIVQLGRNLSLRRGFRPALARRRGN